MFKAVVLSLLTSSCAATWHLVPNRYQEETQSTAYVCVQLPNAERAEAFKAIELWDEAIGTWKHLSAIESADNAGCAYSIIETTNSREGAMAWTETIGGRRIWLTIGRYEYATLGIVLHEMGHALGAQHVDGTLMNPVYSKLEMQCPDRDTVEQVAAWNHVNLDMLSWCQP